MTQETFTEVKNLRNRLQECLPSNRGLVSVDGFPGSGKTLLVGALAEQMNAHHFDIDQFLNQDQDGYVDHIRYDELSPAIRSVPSGIYPIVEGCCVLQVLDRLNLVPNVTIYVKRLIGGRRWLEGEFLDKYATPEEAIASDINEIKKSRELFPDYMQTLQTNNSKDIDLIGLRKELIHYHYVRRPHETAHFIYAP